MAPKKGQASKVMLGEEDFTTKKTSKDYERGGIREKKAEGAKKDSKPFASEEVKTGKTKMRKMTEEEKELIKQVIDKKKLDKSGQAKLRMKVMRSSEPVKDLKAMMKLA